MAFQKFKMNELQNQNVEQYPEYAKPALCPLAQGKEYEIAKPSPSSVQASQIFYDRHVDTQEMEKAL